MKVVLFNHLTLDGVMQAPGRADEDTRGGFTHGGWTAPYGDAVMGAKVTQGMAQGAGQGAALLFGRRTYEDFYSVWPNRTDNPFTEPLNRMTKYVASRTLTAPLPWSNSVLLDGDACDAVAELKRSGEGGLTIMGSGVLAQSLMQRGLIDQYLLMIHPLVLGSGRRLFTEPGAFAKLRLVEALPTTTGVIMATYEPA